LAKVALETRALCDIQLRRLANGNPACTFVRVVTLMEFLMVPFFAFAALLVAVGIAQGSQTWEMEDPPYVNVNLRVKPVREVDRKQPTPLQTPDPAVTVDKKPEKAAVSDDLGKTKLVQSVMEKQAYYCRENQSMDEALRIMREHGLQYLPVVDSNLRIVGVVRRHY
jgi:CBS domain-containing protein